MKARKKPAVIDYFPASLIEVTAQPLMPPWLREAMDTGAVRVEKGKVFVKSREGEVSGDVDQNHVMRGVRYELYLCNIEIFDATYETIEE